MTNIESIQDLVFLVFSQIQTWVAILKLYATKITIER